VNSTPESRIAGVDEAGRGCLAGPVYAAAVILAAPIEGLNDSKKLSAVQRERLYAQIQSQALAWSIARAEVDEIERLNILRASLLAMQRAVAALKIVPDEALVDGNQPPRLACRVTTVIDGDALHPCIMAASILAKVARDREMCTLDQRYPGYGFARHKGYGTAQHLLALRSLGPCTIHRRTFAPIAQLEIPGLGTAKAAVDGPGFPIQSPESP
jgi:ribonuclease HII